MTDTLTEQPRPEQTSRKERRPADGRRGIGSPVWGGALILLGTLWLLEMLGVDVPWAAILPLGVIAVGLALIVGSRTGPHGGLIWLGIALTALSAITLTFEAPLTAGDRAYRPTSIADVQDVYELGMGNLVVDLRDVTFPADNTDLTIRLNVGELRVLLPEDVAVGIDSAVGVGDLRVLDRHESGIGPHIQLFDDPPGNSGVLTLRTNVGVGSVEVDR